MGRLFYHHNSSWLTASNLRLTGLILDTIASVIVALHVIILHAKLTVDKKGDALVVLNDREGVERVILIIAVVIIFLSFLLAAREVDSKHFLSPSQV